MTPSSRSARARYATSLVVLPTEDFPSMTAGDLPHRFSLPRPALRGLIDRTRVRHQHRGDPLLPERHLPRMPPTSRRHRVLRAVATDGHRLARVEEPSPEGAGSMPGVIIPRKTVAEKLFPDRLRTPVLLENIYLTLAP